MKRKRFTTAIVAVIVSVFFPVSLLLAGDSSGSPSWPEFHRSGRTNISPGKGLLEKWPKGGPKLIWTYSQCGRRYSGVAIAHGMIYVLNHQGTMYLMAVIPDEFEIVSRFELKRKPANSYLAHPVVCGGRMYIRCGQDLYVYDVSAK